MNIDQVFPGPQTAFSYQIHIKIATLIKKHKQYSRHNHCNIALLPLPVHRISSFFFAAFLIQLTAAFIFDGSGHPG